MVWRYLPLLATCYLLYYILHAHAPRGGFGLYLYSGGVQYPGARRGGGAGGTGAGGGQGVQGARG
jgi:hypothetical protein